MVKVWVGFRHQTTWLYLGKDHGLSENDYFVNASTVHPTCLSVIFIFSV